MWDINVTDALSVDLVDHMGSDELICRAARVSTLGAGSIDTSESQGLISYLMRSRHGSPFEHGSMVFLVKAPIFVAREQMRHRIGFSYNEESGRYRELKPDFYIPNEQRAIVQIGKPGEYMYVQGTRQQYMVMDDCMMEAYQYTWQQYQTMLNHGIAKEVARMVLPVGLFSSWYVTCNPRSMMAYLSLRTHEPESKFPSFPMFEIEQVARKMESTFAELFPTTYTEFVYHGRVSP